MPTGPMTLTRGSFTYSSGEEYHGEWKEGKTHLLHLPPILHHWLHLHAQHKHCYYVIKTITHRQGPSSWKHHIMRANALKWNKGNLRDIRGALSSEPIIILDIKQICDISWSTVVSCLLPTQFSLFIFCYGENKMKTDWTKTIINNYYLEQLLITLEQQHKNSLPSTRELNRWSFLLIKRNTNLTNWDDL